MSSFFSERKSQNTQIKPGGHLNIQFPVANPGVIRAHSVVADIPEPGLPPRPVTKLAQRLELFKPGTNSPVASAEDTSGQPGDLELEFRVLEADAGLPGNWIGRVTNLANVIGTAHLDLAYPGTTPVPDRFPDSFLWGAATAAYQAEGNIFNNDWDDFVSDPGIASRVKLNGTQAVPPENFELRQACFAIQHGDIEALKKDLDRCKLLGMNAYRFSVEWSRIQPCPGSIDRNALGYYERVVQELRARNMVPIVTLSHFSLPRWVLTPPDRTVAVNVEGVIKAASAVSTPAFEAARGWERDGIVADFLSFVQLVVTRLRNDVRYWTLLNEPNGQIALGYLGGVWPPGFLMAGSRAKAAYFNMIRAHVRGYDLIKTIDPHSQVGVAQHIDFCKTLDSQNARDQFDYFMHFHFLNAVVEGETDIQIDRENPHNVNTGEFAGIAGPWHPRLDFIGVNYYRSASVNSHHDLAKAGDAPFIGGALDAHEPGAAGLLTDISWEIFPEGLYRFIADFHNRYKLPILITENGISEVADTKRAGHLVAHLGQTLRAMREDVSPPINVLGYIHWTIADNFEWQYGYDPRARFGLFTVDRDHRDSDDHFLRHLTEGAVAMQYVIAEGDLNGAADSFGVITENGKNFLPPTGSPGSVWAGAAGVDDVHTNYHFRLYLNRLASGQLIGMIFYLGPNVWLRLEGVEFDAARKQLSFFHGAQPGLEPRRYLATVADKDFSGTVTFEQPSEGKTIAARELRWKAANNPLFGVWRQTEKDFYLSFWNAEGTFGGTQAKIRSGPNSGWHRVPVTASADDRQVTITLSAGTRIDQIIAKVQDDRLIGTRVPVNTTFEARRLPDQLPFG